MDHLVVARHGKYGPDHRLDGDGRASMKRLAEMLKSLLRGTRIAILSSDARRARDSAEVLASQFGVRFEEHSFLYSDAETFVRLAKVLALVRERQSEADMLILMTHYEYVRDFPTYFAEEELGFRAPITLVEKGEALLIDCTDKIVTHLQP